MIFLILFFLIILFVILFYVHYTKNRVEYFDDFSPYIGNHAYPFVYEKTADQQALRRTLRQWEKPYNTHNEGYYSAEPTGNPPLVPIYSYTKKR